MPLFSKDSLEALRQRVDLVDVLSTHIDLKRSGAAYKGLCPFHDEKTPSFLIQKGDTHYHCFGCGAHGDAIQFLMSHLKMGFMDAVESLGQRFNVPLQLVEETTEIKGPSKTALKEALELAAQFYHLMLLYTAEGHQALHYLYHRGIDLEFIYRFRIGLAPGEIGKLRPLLHGKYIRDETMSEAGLIVHGQNGGWRDFFQDRIMFPICEASGAIIGFSARKYKEETFGGKYVNTSETALFKKSKVLFGLNYSRKRIIKERKAIIVEGQIDALRLISLGFNLTVAAQGTAFGEGHVKELIALGVNNVFLALDNDEAGQQAAVKTGDLFQKEGIEVRVLQLPSGSDPDLFLRTKGPEAFMEAINHAIDYLSFLVWHLSKKINVESPAGKTEIVQIVTKQIRTWNSPLMVHESLRKLAHLARVPESIVGVGQEHVPNLYIQKTASIGVQTIDPDRILESDFLRWLLLTHATNPHFVEIARQNILPQDLHVTVCRHVYEVVMECLTNQKPTDLLSLAIRLDDTEGQLLMSELLQKKVNLEKAEKLFVEAIQSILNRNWMKDREEIKIRIQSGQCSDEEVEGLIKKFDELKRTPPKVQLLQKN